MISLTDDEVAFVMRHVVEGVTEEQVRQAGLSFYWKARIAWAMRQAAAGRDTKRKGGPGMIHPKTEAEINDFSAEFDRIKARG